MPLKTKIVLLAVLPLIATILLIAFTVRHQERELAQRQRALVEEAYMQTKQNELRHYVELALSTIKPLYESGRNDEATRQEAMRLLAAMDYGQDGYFFLYDMRGINLMHARQQDLIGKNLWELRDPSGLLVIQELIAKAKSGGGFVRYMWEKPSTKQVAPKLGYVVGLDRWEWMFGTGLYLDDIEGTMAEIDRQVTSSVAETLLLITGIALLGVAVIGICGMILNLSEHKIAYGKLRLLTHQVVQSQEDERAHLSRELHDGTSQTLVSVKLLVESGIDQLEAEGVVPPRPFSKSVGRLNDALNEVRRISHRLRPPMLDTLGVVAALRHLVDEFNHLGGMACSMVVEGEPFELPVDAKTILFRVAQEAITNASKHAFATHLEVLLEFADGGVRLSVRDDGTGFDTNAVQQHPSNGIGLRNMRERLQSVGGQCNISSRPGFTVVDARMPLEVLDRIRNTVETE
ncbi:cache domain-containing protein [Piscinibacter sp. HJYY11]|uniref:cache domain-containing protein n=1 Tax=Piscinibacter sp. HJYY11 TaxID=2801333 RepID=UPI00191DE52C|nr:cache domain-containing protein [Piscinibacter sp. HJYY11]MBL0729883.1 cache domain-containing protein [Piscinibacter sp. HJYY11]